MSFCSILLVSLEGALSDSDYDIRLRESCALFEWWETEELLRQIAHVEMGYLIAYCSP